VDGGRYAVVVVVALLVQYVVRSSEQRHKSTISLRAKDPTQIIVALCSSTVVKYCILLEHGRRRDKTSFRGE
jgi:hypothetical protein